MKRLSLLVVGALFLTGCRDMVARFWDKAFISSYVTACPGAVLAVGDSIQFHAYLRIKNAPGGMQGAYDNVTLFTSDERPSAFEWWLSYPPPSTPTFKTYPIGSAEITKTGMLIAKDTGVVYVHTKGAGKEAARVEMTIVPRVARFKLLPHDTALSVGDTLWLRADAELAAKFSPYYTFSWTLGLEDTPANRRVERVERDPAVKTERDVRDFPVVAVRAGTAKVAACFAGARLDTTTIEITGEAKAPNRDVAPRVRLSPAGDTSVYLGEEFHQRVRILNANLRNGPYRWFATTGDGTEYSDSNSAVNVASAFGFEADVFVDHRYFVPGKYPVSTTVIDAAGRSTTVRSTYTATPYEFATMVVFPQGKRFVRLDTAGAPDVAVALLGNKAKRLFPAHITGSIVATEMHGVPPLLFGKTVFDPERDGRRRVTKDVNGDGEPDVVFYLDKTMLRRNGNLKVGRNRLDVTGVIGQRISRPGRESAANFYPPIRAVVEFEVIP